MMTSKSTLSPARTALFAALLSGSAMVAAQDATMPEPVIDMPAPAEQPVIGAPPPVETPVIVIPSTPPVAETPIAPNDNVTPEAKRTAQPEPVVASSKASAPKPVAQRAAPVQQTNALPAADIPAGSADTAIVPEEAAFAVPVLPEPVAVMPTAEDLPTEPVNNGNGEENWILAAAGLGLLGAAGGAAVVAGKRRRRKQDARGIDKRIFPASAAPMPKKPVEPSWTGERVVAALNNRTHVADHVAVPATNAALRRTDPVFASKVSGPPITDPLFSAKVVVPPVVDPLFRNHPDYVGPGANIVAANRTEEPGWNKPHRSTGRALTPEFAV